MARKIYDIKPPKVAKKAEVKPDGKIKIKRNTQTVSRPPITRKKNERRSVWGTPWVSVSITVLVILLAVGVYLFFKLPKADIAIWPRVDVLSFQQTITGDKSADSVDIVKNTIPAYYFQTTKINAQDFPATGNGSNEGYASGSILITNKYNPVTPFTFKAGTHFMSDSGKLFITFQKVVIPAATKSGSKIIPGTIKINVQAVEGGTGYNIAPSNFSISGLKGTAYYYSVTAASSSAMTGGYSGKVKKVTDDDISGAKDVLTKKTTSDALADLKSQISDDYVLLDNAILSNVASASTKTKTGTVADNFNYSVTANASALAFKKSDLEQFAKNYIISKLADGKSILEKEFKLDYSANVVDVSGGKATLNLVFSSGIYQGIDKNSMSLSLLGKNISQIKEIIGNTLGDQVSELRINLWPFWVTKAPNNQKAVNIDLKFQ
ncbi:MAG: hypothetical protein NTW11_02155 [Candidatus Staskawiczbacteria bacterium]|nr:hypothetical protein [Candidatus Staskawiczbacteria bacterium]